MRTTAPRPTPTRQTPASQTANEEPVRARVTVVPAPSRPAATGPAVPAPLSPPHTPTARATPRAHPMIPALPVVPTRPSQRRGRQRAEYGITSEQFAAALRIVGSIAGISHLLALPYHTCLALRQRALFEQIRLPELRRGRVVVPCTPAMLDALEALQLGIPRDVLDARAAHVLRHSETASLNRARRQPRHRLTAPRASTTGTTHPATRQTPADRPSAAPQPIIAALPTRTGPADTLVDAGTPFPRSGIRVSAHLTDVLTRFHVRRIHRDMQRAMREARRASA